MDINHLFMDAVFETPDCPDTYGRVSIPNSHIAAALPRRVTDLDKLTPLHYEGNISEVLTRSSRNRFMRAVDCFCNVTIIDHGAVMGFVPEHFVYLPKTARLNSHGFIVGKINEFDYRIFPTQKYATIEFPQIVFPQFACDAELEKTVFYKIQQLNCDGHANDFQKTGKSYTFYLTNNRAYKAQEYKIDNRYVAVAQSPIDPITTVLEVKPIRYAILNYGSLPKNINPKGSGTAKAMNIASVNALMACKVDFLWEFSHLREYANDEFLKEINHSENENENS